MRSRIIHWYWFSCLRYNILIRVIITIPFTPGGILVPVSIFANIASAYICRRLKLDVRGALWFTIILVSLSVPFLPVMMAVGCPNGEVAGVTVGYMVSGDMMTPLGDQSG